MITALHINLPTEGEFTCTYGKYFPDGTCILDFRIDNKSLTLILQGDNPPGIPMNKADAEARERNG